MAAAALIIALLAFAMATANLVIYLSKNVFSSHTIQMVPAESLPIGKQKEESDPFHEFDVPTAMDIAFNESSRNRKITQ